MACGPPTTVVDDRVPAPLPEAGPPGVGVAAGPSTTAPLTTPPIDGPREPELVTDPDDRAVVDGALERYGRALTELSAAPEAVDDPTDPLLAQWHRVVAAESELDLAVRDRIRGRRAEGVVVRPPTGGRSYAHRAVDVVRSPRPAGVPDAPEELAFTWCGWSPGVAVRAATGEVVDDLVGHGRGTGSLRRPSGGEWTVASLLETEFATLPAGSTDPCA